MKVNSLMFEESVCEFVKEISGQEPGKTRIAILVQAFSKFNGIGRVAEQQANELSKNGYKVTIFAFDADTMPHNNVKLKLIRSPQNAYLNVIHRLFFPLDLIALVEWMRLIRTFDLIIAHHYPFTLVAYLAKCIFGIKYIYWHHHAIPTTWQSKLLHKFYVKLILYLDEKSFIIKHADYIVSISQFSRELLRTNAGIDSIVIPNKIDNRFTEGLDDNKIRNRLNIKKDPLILFVGRITPSKNIHTLIDVFKMVKEQIPNVRLVIVGKESIFDYDYLEHLKGIGEESGVIFAGYVSDEDLPHYYAACNVYATCSLSEGFNLPIVEAQKCGKTVVAFNIGPHKEVVKNGFLVDEGNVEEFANKIIEILTNAQKHSKEWN